MTFADLVRSGAFVVTAELNPPKSASADVVRRRAARLRGFVDAVNVTDSNRAVVAMAAIPAALLAREAQVEPIVQMTCRDRNRIALQSELLGAAALGLENFVFMTGDDPKEGNHPEAVNVRDLDGIGLLRAAKRMRDEGRFLSGDAVRQPPRYFMGATAAPFADPMEADVRKTLEKAEAGAEFFQTQPVFDVPAFERWLRAVRAAGVGLPIIAGALVLRSASQAERLARVPGVALPARVIERMRSASDAAEEGVAIAVETVRALRGLESVAGAHLYAIEWPQAVGRVVERAGLLPRPGAG